MPDEQDERPRWAKRLEALRLKLGMNQSLFASALGTKQNNVSRWESGTRPSPDMFTKIAALAPDADRFFFLEEAGVPKEFFLGDAEKKLPSALIEASARIAGRAFGMGSGDDDHRNPQMTRVCVLADAMAAGNPLTVNEKDVEQILWMPTAWFPKGAQLYGVRVQGDSMQPVLSDRDIAIVDVSKRDLRRLNMHIIAARIGDGVTVKRLQKSGRYYLLMPENTSPEHAVRIMTENDEWSVVGEVVKWIGAPPARK